MNPRLIGGEMMVWSDLDGRHGAGPVQAATLRPLLGAVSRRTLVAGPHSPALLSALPSAELTLLVRGLPDADYLADRFDATVLCGSLSKLAAAPAFDTVIALDGLGRLRSAEDETSGATWSDSLARLVSVLAPGGRLLLGVENLFGLHRMLALPPSPADADWGDEADEYDESRPASPALLRSALGELGLEVRASYGAFPGPGNPSLLLSTSLLADRSVRGWATAAIRTAFSGDTGSGGAVSAEAIPPTTDATRAGSGSGATAPIAPAPAGSASGAAAPVVPALAGSASMTAAPLAPALAEPGRIAAGAMRAGIGAELACGWVVVAQGASGSPLPPLPAAVVGTDPVESDLPVGPTLDELLLAASLRRDLPALRELLAEWQGGPDAGVPADRIVVGRDGTRTPLAAAAQPEAALARLAATMIREGHAYLWPAPADRADLTALLAAMAGREAAEIPADAAEPTLDLRELLMERDRLTRELAEARARHDWYEGMLQGREAELKRVRRINTMLMATMPGKAAKASYGGLRAAKRALRKLKS
ncbi:hypothetical protein ACIA5C_09680 [Actinoplanes sp. NPDC051343]|uniref:hypothetical protein n=1 Tax=Actinoplanes sp. NPDC051343 TaxID=3363906 RepID=UPI00378F8DF6